MRHASVMSARARVGSRRATGQRGPVSKDVGWPSFAKLTLGARDEGNVLHRGHVDPSELTMLSTISDGVWVASAPVSFLGLRLTSTMTVLRLADGSLLVHSPLQLTAALSAHVAALGRVAELYAPNTLHHLWLGEWIAAFPSARVHAPKELARKRPDLRIDRFHDHAPGAAADGGIAGLEEIPIRGFRLRETALVHRAGRTAIVSDLVHHIGRPEHAWTKAYTKAMGFYDRVALSRLLRWTSFDDRGAARRSVDALLAHSFDALIVGHGAPITRDARSLLAAATAWLPSADRTAG